jgi:TPP-dependent indolepyruvate ferredoxin oxidoreductase alpha subunit
VVNFESTDIDNINEISKALVRSAKTKKSNVIVVNQTCKILSMEEKHQKFFATIIINVNEKLKYNFYNGKYNEHYTR